VDRVDLAVGPPLQEVRLDGSVHVGLVIAAGVVVFDSDVAVEKQALRDHQVMRLVAVRMRRCDRPRGEAEEHGGHHAREDSRSRGG
jgi:hypothetical protein